MKFLKNIFKSEDESREDFVKECREAFRQGLRSGPISLEASGLMTDYISSIHGLLVTHALKKERFETKEQKHFAWMEVLEGGLLISRKYVEILKKLDTYATDIEYISKNIPMNPEQKLEEFEKDYAHYVDATKQAGLEHLLKYRVKI